MRTFISRMFLMAFAVLAACTPQPQPPPQHPLAPKGIEQSIHPIVFSGDVQWYGDTTTWWYNTCNAAYVTPHVLVTSAHLFDHVKDRRPDVELIRLRDGDKAVPIESVTSVLEPGLIFVRTAQEGKPLPLAKGPPAKDAELRFVGLARARSYFQGRPDEFEWLFQPAVVRRSEVDPSIIASVRRRDRVPVLCGTPIMDGENLAGIVLDEAASGQRVVSAQDIARVLAGLYF